MQLYIVQFMMLVRINRHVELLLVGNRGVGATTL